MGKYLDGSGRRASWLLLSACAGFWTPACGKDAAPASSKPVSGVFGGTSGAVDATPLSGTGGSVVAGAGAGGGTADACANTPPGTLALIDDFDDGDSVAAIEPFREAYWFTVNDGSAGTFDPPGTFFPVPGGYHGTPSAHVSARNFTIWGAELSANISHLDTIRCPYNASAFAGVRFVARGHGHIRVQVAMPEVVEKEYGGKCDPTAGQVCYDVHGAFVTLSDHYRVYELPWSSLTQRSFGVQVAFNPKTIMTLHFSMEKADEPAELWLDNVEFWDGTPSTDTGAGGDGAGGDGAGGDGNAGSAGSADAGSGGDSSGGGNPG